MSTAKLTHLGQTGLKVDLPNLSILIDPYLSNSVQELDSPDLVRKLPVPVKPESLDSINWVLITHDHLDHCDPHTLPIVAEASPHAQFMGPEPVRLLLKSWGIRENRIHAPHDNRRYLGSGLFVTALPSAHPRIRLGSDQKPVAVGWLLERNERKLYVAGDTSVCEEVMRKLIQHGKIHTALLPVNEDNFFRRRRGIIGNMSIREAFQFATEVDIDEVVPVHWDLFEANSALPEEISLLYNSYNWPFKLTLSPELIQF